MKKRNEEMRKLIKLQLIELDNLTSIGLINIDLSKIDRIFNRYIVIYSQLDLLKEGKQVKLRRQLISCHLLIELLFQNFPYPEIETILNNNLGLLDQVQKFFSLTQNQN